MRIGLINQLHGRPGGDQGAPTWDSITARAAAAEEAGFDIFVFEDALLYRGKETTDGVWESVSIAGALAATTQGIRIGHSVVNTPYRSPAMTASLATTLDEISGGRYVLGIGAGNTWDSDYEAFGFPTDMRYSRFAEAIQIIHGLLRTGIADFEGEFYSVKQGELVLRGPNPHGPPINIAAGGLRMLGLAARYADEWNWWAWDETVEQVEERFGPIIETLEVACAEESRDPGTLTRTLDVYTMVPEGFATDGLKMEQPVVGTVEQLAGFVLALGELGFAEVRCDVWPKTIDAIEAMRPVVDLVHEG